MAPGFRETGGLGADTAQDPPGLCTDEAAVSGGGLGCARFRCAPSRYSCVLIRLCPGLPVSLPGSAVFWVGCDLAQFQRGPVRLVPVQPFLVEPCPGSTCPVLVHPVPVHPVLVRPVPFRLTCVPVLPGSSDPYSSRPGPPRPVRSRSRAAQCRHLPVPPYRHQRDPDPMAAGGSQGDPIPTRTLRGRGTLAPSPPEAHGTPGLGPAQPTGALWGPTGTGRGCGSSAGREWRSPGRCGGR